jgi:hypothetical protein
MWPRNRHAPASTPTARVAPTEPGDDLAGWREERLLRAGVEPELASSIAADCAIDLHAMIELVERGCPPSLAAQILAPLEYERNPC